MKAIVFGKSVRGASHKRADKPLEDRYRKLSPLEDGTIIMAVADGHGSADCPYSGTGAESAVNTFCDVMKDLHLHYADNMDMLLTYLNREGVLQIAQTIDKEWKRRIRRIHCNNKRAMPRIEEESETQLFRVKRPRFVPEDKQQLALADVYKQYGTTLLGVMIAPTFCFTFQLGDGDACYIDDQGYNPMIQGDKILGVETHSLSKLNSWEKAVSSIHRKAQRQGLPAMYLLSTDGFCNSYENEEAFQKTCVEYYEAVKNYGYKKVNANLEAWLDETSEMGCGDDITVLMAYFSEDQ